MRSAPRSPAHSRSANEGFAGKQARLSNRFGLSWTAILTLLIGLAFHMPVVRIAAALVLSAAGPQAGDIAADYVNQQLRNTHIEIADESNGYVLASEGVRNISPLIKAHEAPFTLKGRGEPDLVVGATVAPNAFVRVCPKAILGRTLQPSDSSARRRIVLLSERLWRRRFDSDPTLIGKTIILNDRAYTVIGVMPANFWFPYRSDPVELWVPERPTGAVDLLIT